MMDETLFLNGGRNAVPSIRSMASNWLINTNQGVTFPSNLVSAWDDQGSLGAGNNASQVVSGSAFAYAAGAGPTGQPLITGSATKWMTIPDSASMRPSGAFAVFIAARRTGVGAFQCLLNSSSNLAWTNGWFGITTGADGTTMRAYCGNNATMAVTYASDTNWHVHELFYNGTVLDYLVDGVSRGTIAATPSSGGPIVLGNGIATLAPTYNYPWRGNIDGGGLYPSPTTGGRSLVRRGWGSRLGIGVTP